MSLQDTTRADDGYEPSPGDILDDRLIAAFSLSYHRCAEDGHAASWWTGWAVGLLIGTLCGVVLALVAGGRP